MIAHSIFFYIFSIIAILSAIMVTVSKNTVHSVFFLILDFISISCLFIMIGAEFVGMIMLIVYVGAVAVLFLFVVIIVVGGWKFKPNLNPDSLDLNFISEKTNTHSIGEVLYTDYIHLFQLSGMILLVAMIGAIVLTFRKRSGIKKQSYFKQVSRERSDGVELIDVKSKKGVKIDV